MTKRLLTFMTFAACAFAQTFTGEHYTGDVCQPDNPNQETGCAYVGNISGDPYAAYGYITDTTGVNFPTINPRAIPPTVNLTGPWNASITWNNGTGVGGTIAVTGTCSATGGYHGGYSVTYTVMCMGTDSNGNPASKVHLYVVRLATSRAGGFWQPPQDATGTTAFSAQ